MELEPETMKPKTEWKELLFGDGFVRGFERMGEDHCEFPRSKEEVEQMFQEYVKQSGIPLEQIPKAYHGAIRGMFTRRPFIEGPWMDKYQGKYYLQYACPGTEYNTYADGVYISDTSARTVYIGEKQSVLLSSGRIYAGSRTWFNDEG